MQLHNLAMTVLNKVAQFAYRLPLNIKTLYSQLSNKEADLVMSFQIYVCAKYTNDGVE